MAISVPTAPSKAALPSVSQHTCALRLAPALPLAQLTPPDASTSDDPDMAISVPTAPSTRALPSVSHQTCACTSIGSIDASTSDDPDMACTGCGLLITLQNILAMKASPPSWIKPGDLGQSKQADGVKYHTVTATRSYTAPGLREQPTQKAWTTQTRWIYGLLDALPTSYVLTDHSSFLHLLGVQLNKDSSTVRMTFQKIALSSATPGRNSFVFYWQWTPKSSPLHLGR